MQGYGFYANLYFLEHSMNVDISFAIKSQILSCIVSGFIRLLDHHHISGTRLIETKMWYWYWY